MCGVIRIRTRLQQAMSAPAPFVDGNERTALASIIVFLGRNRIDFEVPPEVARSLISLGRTYFLGV
jgi:prophage maintenance system killer protein